MTDIKKTAVNMGLSRNSSGSVILYVKDEHSGELIVNCEMTPKELGLLVTGMHGIKAIADVNMEQVIAERRVTESVTCKRVDSLDREAQRQEVINHFQSNFDTSVWTIQSDGTSTQQHGREHRYVIKSYEPVEDPTYAVRYY